MDIVCLRNISINTLHKGDDNDDDGGGDDDDDNSPCTVCPCHLSFVFSAMMSLIIIIIVT